MIGSAQQFAAPAGAALERARAGGRSVLLSVSSTIAAPEDPLWLIERAEPAEQAFLWQRPDEQKTLVAIGTLNILTAEGPDRFCALAASCREAGEAPQGRCAEDAGALFVGGFAFGEQMGVAAEWRGFPAGCMVLPRLQVVQSGSAARLTCNLRVTAEESVDTIVGRAAAELSRLQRHSATRAADRGARYEVESSPSLAAWRDAIRATLADIEARRLEKLVLARSCLVRSSRRFDCARIVRRLRQAYPACTIFWLRTPGGSFLGASPEILASLQNGVVRTGAVAGSMARGSSVESDRLLAERLLESTKERHEHAVVVRGIESALSSVCSEIHVAPHPQLLRLENVQHLITPIHGRVSPGYGILDVVGRLHPTPAVAGHPRQVALEILRQRERLDRGWYAGPIGWMDQRGNGEFAVALRCALVREDTATVFAGAGIVAGSDPEAELAETRLKMQPLMSALMEI